MSDDHEVQQINSERKVVAVQSGYSRFEKCSQTAIKDNILYEKYHNVLRNNIKEYIVGGYDVRLSITKGHHSHNVLITFDINKDEKVYKLKCILFALEISKSELQEDVSDDEEYNATTEYHLAYLNYIRPDDDECIIVSVEQFIDPDGIHIKLHDMKQKVSTVIMLSKQHLNNSQEIEYSEIDIEIFNMKPDSMRNEMVELFSLASSVLNPNDMIMIPKIPKIKDDKSLSFVSDDERTNHSNTSMQNAFNVDKIFKEKSKGVLMFRDLVLVRYIHDTKDQNNENNDFSNIINLYEKETTCLISFYKNNENEDLINVEVFLKDFKVAISSQVSASDAFNNKQKLTYTK